MVHVYKGTTDLRKNNFFTETRIETRIETLAEMLAEMLAELVQRGSLRHELHAAGDTNASMGHDTLAACQNQTRR